MTKNDVAEVPVLKSFDVSNVPMVYFAGAPSFGNRDGAVNVTLDFNRHIPARPNAEMDVLGCSHLCCSQNAARDLIDALQNALLIGVPPAGPKQ